MLMVGGLKGNSFHLLPREPTVCTLLGAPMRPPFTRRGLGIHKSIIKKPPHKIRMKLKQRGLQHTKSSLKLLTKAHILKSWCPSKKTHIYLMYFVNLGGYTQTHTPHPPRFLRGIKRDNKHADLEKFWYILRAKYILAVIVLIRNAYKIHS